MNVPEADFFLWGGGAQKERTQESLFCNWWIWTKLRFTSLWCCSFHFLRFLLFQFLLVEYHETCGQSFVKVFQMLRSACSTGFTLNNFSSTPGQYCHWSKGQIKPKKERKSSVLVCFHQPKSCFSSPVYYSISPVYCWSVVFVIPVWSEF